MMTTRKARLWMGWLCTLVFGCTGNFRLPGDNKAPGTFEVEFRWRGTKPEPSGNIFVFGFVLDCAGVDDTACMDARVQRQLAVAGPQVYDGTPDLAFDSVPNGSDRVVLMEFREGNTLEAQVLYAGRSARFALEPGKHVVVPVEVEIVATPAGPGASRPTVVIQPDVTVMDGSPGGRRYVKSANVMVKVTSEGATRIRISADPTMSNAAVTQTHTVASLTAAPGGGVLVPWDVQQGQQPCTAPAGCTRTVYVRVLDAQGYASNQVADSVILDVVDPDVTGTSGPIAGTFRAADEIIYLVDFDEPMTSSPAPTLVARDGSGTTVVTFDPPEMSPSGTTFTFRAPGATSVADGPLTLQATGTDLAQRPLGTHTLPGVTLDGTPPVISNVSLPNVTTPTFTRNAVFNVRFDVNEPVTVAEVAVGGRPASRVSGSGAGTWEFTYTVDAMAMEGVQPVTIRVLDSAGNQGAALAPSVLLDFTGPQLTFAVVPTGRTARLGEVVALTVASNEPLNAQGIVLNSGGFPMMGPQGTGTTYVWSGDVPLGVSGTFTMSATATDTAGNAGSAGTPAVVTVDGVPPTAQNLRVDPPRVRAGETFRVRFTASEDLANDPVADYSNGVTTRTLTLESHTGRDYVFVGVAPDLVTVDGGVPDAGNDDGGNADGGPGLGGPYYTITLTLVDVPGNVTRLNTQQPLEIDNVPAVATLQVSPPAARRGDEVRIIVSANEVLAQAPRDRTVTGDPARLVVRHRALANTEIEFVLVEMDTPDAPGISFAYRALMGGSQVDGLYDVLPADVLDVAGNASVLDPNGATLNVDVTPPSITSPTGLAAILSANTGFNLFTLDFDTSEPATISVAVGDWDLLTRGGSCMATPSGNLVHHSCSYTITAMDALTTASGPATVRVTARDAAQNTSFESLSLVLDFDAPELLAEPLVEPSPAGINRELTYTIAVNEPLLNNLPVVTLLGAGAPVLDYRPGTQYTFVHVVRAGTTNSGSFQPSVTLTDVVGNTVTLTDPAVVKTVDLDAVAPQVTIVDVSRRELSRVAPFNTFTVTATVTDDQALASVQLAGMGTTVVPCIETVASPGTYTCSYTVTGADTEGVKAIRVAARDLAGNLTTGTDSVTMDFTPPDAVTATVAPPLLAADGTAVLTLIMNEAVVAAPTLSLTRTGGAAAQPPVFTPVAGTTFVYTALISSTTTNGEYQVGFTATDMVGNTATRSGPPGFLFQVDAEAPQIRNLLAFPRTYSRVPGFDTVVVEFDRFDTTGFTGAATPTMRVGSNTVTCVEGTTDHFTCTYQLTAANTAGLKNVEISVWDGAGNEVNRQSQVTFDFSPPSILASSAGPSPAGIGNVVVINASLDEDAAGVPTLVLTRSGGAANPPVCSPVAGAVYSWTCPILVNTTGGEYDIDLVVTDTVGNTTTRNGPASFKFTVDSNIPNISNLTTNGVVPSVDQPARFSRNPGFNSVVVTFTVSEAIPQAPTMQLGNQAPVACANTGGNDWSCTHNIPAVGGTEGVKDFNVSLADAAGNIATAQVVVLFDFSGPRIDGTATRIYLPGAGNPKTVVTGMTVGTGARLLFDADEQLGADPVVSTPPAASLTWTKDAAASSGNSYAYATTLSTTPGVQGLVDITVDLTDLVGNTRSIVTSPRIRIDTVAPVAPLTTAGALRYTRIPFGGDGTGGVPQFSVNASPATFEASSTAYVFSGPAATSQVLGTKGVAADGSLFNLILIPVDLPVVYAAAVDDAGNIGPLVDIKDVVWRVTLGGKVAGRLYPNYSVFTSGVAYPQALSPGDAFEHGEADGLAGRAEGASLTTTGGARWMRLGGWGNPLGRALAATAYDARRGVLVMFGGRGGAGGTLLLDDTWEWRGNGWSRITPTDPEGDGNPGIREGAAMAYDAARGTVILFGGVFNDGQNRYQRETWEYDGVSWRRVATTGATCRAFHNMAYDEVTRRVLLFGGVTGNANCSGTGTEAQDTWAWSGTAWTQLASANTPPVRQQHAMATFPGNGRVVMMGGLGGGAARSDTWEWNGSGWNQVTGAGTPGARYGAAMTQQVGQGGNSLQLWLTGGTDGTTVLGDVWRYNGTTWTAVPPTDPEADGNPTAREGHLMVWDLARREAILFGGRNAATYNDDTWSYDTVSMMRRGSSDPEGDGNPTPRHAAAAAYDPRAARNKTVLFGGTNPAGCEGNALGFCGETWEFNGASWVRALAADPAGVTAPTPRHSTAATYDTVANRVFVFGGQTAAGEVNDSWRWNGTAWVKLAPAASPAARHSHAMAYDEQRSQTVLFGGRGAVTNCDGSGAFTCNGTWLYDNALNNWVPGAPTNVPTGRRKHAMAYDRDRQRVVMFGGSAEGGAILGDTWEWNGTDWTPFTPAQSPPARACHTMSYDRTRQKVVLFGGSTTNNSCNAATAALNDAWEWDGATWREMASPSVRTADLEADSLPVARLASAMVYDVLRRVHVVVGGLTSSAVQCDAAGGGSICGYPWVLDAGAGDRPVHVYSVPLVGSGEDWDVANPPTVTSIRAQWRGGGDGDSGGGVLANGSALWSWYEGRFVQMVTNGGAPGAPQAFNWDAAVDNPTLTFAGFLQGQDRFITLAFSPRDNAGRLMTRAHVLTDYAEITVGYRRP